MAPVRLRPMPFNQIPPACSPKGEKLSFYITQSLRDAIPLPIVILGRINYDNDSQAGLSGNIFVRMVRWSQIKKVNIAEGRSDGKAEKGYRVVRSKPQGA